MLRVAIVLEDFSIGGAQRVVSELVKNIDQKQTRLLVLCLKKKANTDLANEIEKIAEVHYLGIHGKNLIANYMRVAGELNKFKPEVIHAHLVGQLYSVPYGLLHRKPVIITAHTKPEKAFIKKIEPLIKYGVTKGKIWIVSVSEENQKLVNTYFPKSQGQCVCINNGIDTDSFYRKMHTHFTYINVARQDENKNQAAILRCFKRVYDEDKSVRLILAGDGPCHEKLVLETNEMSLLDAVNLPGAVGNVKDYYAVSDVYVQASHREAMPMSVLEALAAGLPIVSTDVGGLHDVVMDNGILVDDIDEDALYHAMKKMLDCAEEVIREMGLESLRISENYSSKNMAARYVSLYGKVVAENNAS